MKKLKELTKKEYKALDLAGTLYVFHPEATGSFSDDCKTKEEYQVGDWAVIKSYKQCQEGNGISKDDLISKLYDVNMEGASGMYLNESSFCALTDGHYVKIKTKHIQRHATPQEIESHLIQEAKKRGYKHDVRIKSLLPYGGNYKLTEAKANPLYASHIDELWYGGGLVYKQGKWADIIKEEEIKIGTWDVKFFSNKIKVGCKTISNVEADKIFRFQEWMQDQNVTSQIIFNSEGKISIHNGTNGFVTLDNEKKIKIMKNMKL